VPGLLVPAALQLTGGLIQEDGQVMRVVCYRNRLNPDDVCWGLERVSSEDLAALQDNGATA
jgi:hypothetical protein